MSVFLKKSILKKVIPAIVGITFLISCENDIEKVTFFTKDKTVPDVTAKEIQIIYSENGELKIKVLAPEFERFNDKDKPITIFPSGIQVFFFTAEKKIESQLKAGYAKYYENEKLWEARNEVESVNQDGDLLETELLFWDETKEKIYTDKFVKITTPTEVLYGNGLQANQNLTKYKITHLQGTVELKDE